jgi:hypothetical protein
MSKPNPAKCWRPSPRPGEIWPDDGHRHENKRRSGDQEFKRFVLILEFALTLLFQDQTKSPDLFFS